LLHGDTHNGTVFKAGSGLFAEERAKVDGDGSVFEGEPTAAC
jgi:hypothetical protein